MQQLTAELLREVAQKTEDDSARALAELDQPDAEAEGSRVCTQGNLQDFPRSLPQYRFEGEAEEPELMQTPIPAPAAELGRATLDDANDKAVSILYALAAALEANPDIEIPNALLIPVRPYIEAYSDEIEKASGRKGRAKRR
ncbi:hypothetical protein IVA95_22655 [Bradyrhizobium sp. 157]|uniref:hypothetical protein n=1 Tax=Bradyrhizobium sp. 157 TaxID=2782631 RepID=UPI001FFC1841|nr:hypothetical protein [Bradyrhizobium sp. 157]MCK1640330.1 hypothetical protein [Bradyrhizobium sp. 157]